MVAAPFEGNGVVYIYHGSANGLPSNYSQRIVAPSRTSSTSPPMFGHGLSKGADIDGNRYLDVAVGAPEAETVYIYKSYPVIKIKAAITPLVDLIQNTNETFKFKVSWLYESKFPINFDVRLNATVKLDGRWSRASFLNGTNELNFIDEVTSDEKFKLFEAVITFKQHQHQQQNDIFRPIEIEMSHNVLNGIPNGSPSEGREAQGNL